MQQLKQGMWREKYIRKIIVGVLAVSGPEKPIQVDVRCADGRHRQVGAIATGDNKQDECKEEVAMVVNSNTHIDPGHNEAWHNVMENLLNNDSTVCGCVLQLKCTKGEA